MFFRKDNKNKLEQQIEALQKEVVALQKLLTAEQAQLLIQNGLTSQLQEDFAELESELQAARAATSAVNANSAAADALRTEVVGLKAQVSKLQAELEAERAKNAQALEQIKQMQAGQVQHDAAAKQLLEANQENELLLSQLMQVQEELEKIFLDKKQLEAAAEKAAADAIVQIEAQKNITKQVELEVAKLNTSLGAVDVELEAELAKNKVELEQLRKQVAQPTVDYSPKLKEAEQENELLLTQLMQVQEELESYYLDKTKLEKLYQDMQARWARLEKRYPSYVDFGSVEIVAFDNLSEVPSITLRVKGYVQNGAVLDDFLFQTVLEEGQPGIGLATDAQGTPSPGGAIVPKLLTPQSAPLKRFLRIGHTDFRQIMAASAIVSQLEASGWSGVELPKGLDIGFWREPLKVLPAQLQALPVLLRYDEVKLKRELINPDYEHLWLEFKSMSLGTRTWPKFEMRLGAAMVQRVGFSQFPKFEFPLIDGRVKPFESWYAESQDGYGGKLELRFSLEKNVFDTSVWSKLDDADKMLLLRLIYVMPDVLLQLEAEHAAIERPWATWVAFAKAATQVIEANRAAAAKAKQAPEANSQPPAAPARPKSPKVLTVAKASGTKNLVPAKAPPTKAVAKSTAPAKRVVAAKKTTMPKASPAVKKASPAKLKPAV